MAPWEEGEHVPEGTLPKRRPHSAHPISWGREHYDVPWDEEAVDEEADPQRAYDDRVAAVLDMIQEQVYKRRLRVKDCFRDFDRLNCGRLTQQQFARCLSRLLPGISISDMNLITQHFKCKEDRRINRPQVYDYLSFVKCVEEVFGPSHPLEHKPKAETWRPGDKLRYKNQDTKEKLTEEEETQFWDVMHRLAVLTKTRGIDLHFAFNDGAHPSGRFLEAPVQLVRGCGKVTVPMFRHKFPFQGKFSEEEMRLLLKRYKVYAPEAVEIKSLCRDIDELLAEKAKREKAKYMPANRLEETASFQLGEEMEPGLNRSSSDAVLQERQVPQRPKSAMVSSKRASEAALAKPPQRLARPQSAVGPRGLSISGTRLRPQATAPKVDVMTKLRQITTERRLRFDDIFQDFDKLRKGVVSNSHLRAALTILRVELTNEERLALCERYRGDGGTFCYLDFLADVEGHHGCKAMELTLDMKGTGKYKAGLENDETKVLENIRAVIAKRVAMRGMEIMTCFHDFSKRSTTCFAGHVPASQLGRIMSYLGFVVTEQEVALLCKAYVDTPDGLGFNYLEFCKDVDPTISADMDAAPEPARKTPHNAEPFQNRYFNENGLVVPALSRQRPQSAPVRRSLGRAY